MAAITISNLDDNLRAKLRARADRNGRSMEAEARAILVDAIAPDTAPSSESAVAAPSDQPLTWDTVTDEQMEAIIAEGLQLGSIPAYLAHIRNTLGPMEGGFEPPPRVGEARYVDFSSSDFDDPTSDGESDQ
ncbi:MAG: hypothetical protein QM753_18255 [Thermomicrobiales bacterium]